MTASSGSKKTIGKNIQFDIDYNGSFGAFCKLIRPNNKIHAKYLYHVLRTKFFRDTIEKAVQGANIANLKNEYIDNFKIYVPKSLNDQKRIAHLLGKVKGMIARRKQGLQQLDELLKSVFLEMFGDPVRNEKGWERVTIRDLITEAKYGTSKSAGEGGYKYLRMNNITTEGYWDFSSLKYIDIEASELHKYSLQRNDIVFNRTNSKELVGKTAVYNSDETVVIAGYLIRVRAKKDINPWYIWGYLNSKAGKLRLFNLCRNIVGMANINAQELQNIPILNPPPELQNQFAAIVTKVESLKSRYQSSLSHLENLYGALSQKAFKGELDLGRVPMPVEEETEKHEEVPVLPFDEGLSEAAKRALTDLNTFNNSSASLRALQEAAAINIDSPAMKAAQMLAEQAMLWKNPLDELKNMSSVARAMEDLVKPSSFKQIAKEQLEAFQHTSKLAQQLAASMPKIDTSFIEQQRKIMESASRPFMEMQKTLANLNFTRTTLSGVLDDSEAVARRFQTAIPDYASWQQHYSTPEGIDTEPEEEVEPKYIFTRYDILDALVATEGLSFEDLSVKLTKIESIDLPSYERIRSILFEMLGEGVLKQQFDEESQSLKLRLAE